MFMRSVVKYIYILLLLLFAFNVKAQVNVELKIAVYEGTPRGTKVYVVPSSNNNSINTRSVKRTGCCNLSLKYNDLYTLKIEKNGYVTKIVEVNSDVPESVINEGDGFPTKKIEVVLYPKKDGVDVKIFKQPVVKIAYDRDYDDFVRDKEYEQALKGEIISAENDLKIPDLKKTDIAIASTPKSVSIPDVKSPRPSRRLSSNRPVVRDIKPTYKKVNKPNTTVVKKSVVSKVESKYKSVYKPSSIKAIDDVYAGTDVSEDAPYLERFTNLNNIQLELINNKYKDLLVKADQAFKDKEYVISRYFYHQAIYIKGVDVSVKERLVAIELKLKNNALERFNTRYHFLLSKGNEYYEKKSYSISRYFYNLAKEMKSDDDYVNSKLKNIAISLGR